VADVAVVGAVAAFAAAVVFLRYRQLLFSTFDPEVAEVSGVNVARADLLLALVLAATITATMNVMGVTLIAAALVIPPVIGRLLPDSFARMLVISTGVGGACGFAGVYASYYLDWSSGGSVVLTATVLFLVAYAWSGARRRRLPAGAADVHV